MHFHKINEQLYQTQSMERMKIRHNLVRKSQSIQKWIFFSAVQSNQGTHNTKCKHNNCRWFFSFFPLFFLLHTLITSAVYIQRECIFPLFSFFLNRNLWNAPLLIFVLCNLIPILWSPPLHFDNENWTRESIDCNKDDWWWPERYKLILFLINFHSNLNNGIWKRITRHKSRGLFDFKFLQDLYCYQFWSAVLKF